MKTVSWFGLDFELVERQICFKIRETLNADLYIHLVYVNVLPWTDVNIPVNWEFQQDDSPAHSAKITVGWIKEE